MANNSRRVAGVASLTVDGTPYDVVSGLVYAPSTVKRETKMGLSGVFGYSEMPVAGHISAVLMDNGALSIADFNSLTFSTVQAVLANGKSVIATGAWCTAELEGDAEAGTFSVKFESDNVTELTA